MLLMLLSIVISIAGCDPLTISNLGSAAQKLASLINPLAGDHEFKILNGIFKNSIFQLKFKNNGDITGKLWNSSQNPDKYVEEGEARYSVRNNHMLIKFEQSGPLTKGGASIWFDFDKMKWHGLMYHYNGGDYIDGIICDGKC